MMELTDRHYRFLARLMTRHALLFSEMLTARAVIHGDRNWLLGFDAAEAQLALQLGGSEPALMAEAARVGEQYGYNEININVGCPSDRVQSGRFGACLMAEPALVGQCVKAMQDAVSVPVTVKCRIGIDRENSYDVFADFVEQVAEAGCERFYVHARKAWLDGLSPKENRDIPPLRYDFVYRLKQQMPQLQIIINGGIKSWREVEAHLAQVDGVMLGREAYYNPASLLQVDERIYGIQATQYDKVEVARRYAQYMQAHYDAGIPVTAMSRHLVALFQGVPGAKAWRRHLSTHASKSNSPKALVEDALQLVTEAYEQIQQSAQLQSPARTHH